MLDDYFARLVIAELKRIATALEGINQRLEKVETPEQERAGAVSSGPARLDIPNTGAA